MSSRVHHARCTFVPPYLLARLAGDDDPLARTLLVDDRVRGRRTSSGRREPRGRGAGQPAWSVHDAEGAEQLPGRVARRPGEPATGDAAVDEAADGVAASLAFFSEVYRRDSYDDRGAEVVATVHYGRQYANAFWDGEQLVFGDGDGRFFGRFTASVDVLAHELTHAITEHTAALAYEGQPGALNESVSDVFAACLEQRLRGQSPREADWLIGSEILLPSVDGVALRSMEAPGTAYDDPALGTDPQPAHMRDYVDTRDDSGGVHINSGIPNKAFQLAAVAVGRSSWEGAGRIWYAALTGGDVGPRTDFLGFAAATVAAAGADADAVRGAWAEVGLDVGRGGRGAAGSDVGGAGGAVGREHVDDVTHGMVRVRRTGGFAGGAVEQQLALDDPASGDLAGLVDAAGLRTGAVPGAAVPQPDRFVYEFDVDGVRSTVAEADLTDELRRVVDTVLGGLPDPGTLA